MGPKDKGGMLSRAWSSAPEERTVALTAHQPLPRHASHVAVSVGDGAPGESLLTRRVRTPPARPVHIRVHRDASRLDSFVPVSPPSSRPELAGQVHGCRVQALL